VAFGLGVAQVQRIAHRLQRKVVTSLQVLHGGAQTPGSRGDDLFQILPVRDVLLQQAAVLQRTRDHRDQLGTLKWLGEVIDRASPECVDCNLKVMHAGQHHHSHAGVVPADRVQQRKAVAVRHHNVREHQIAAGVVLQM
jgi:hypothetical protein